MSATESSVKTSSSKEQRIRELAYQIWESEGRPDGQDARHWELANKLADVEVNDEPAPAKRSSSARKPRVATATAAADPIAVAPVAAEGALPPTSRKARSAKNNGTAKVDAPNAARKLRDTTTTDT